MLLIRVLGVRFRPSPPAQFIGVFWSFLGADPQKRPFASDFASKTGFLLTPAYCVLIPRIAASCPFGAAVHSKLDS